MLSVQVGNCTLFTPDPASATLYTYTSYPVAVKFLTSVFDAVGAVKSYFTLNTSDASETFPTLSTALNQTLLFLSFNVHSSVPVAFVPLTCIPRLAKRLKSPQVELSNEYCIFATPEALSSVVISVYAVLFVQVPLVYAVLS